VPSTSDNDEKPPNKILTVLIIPIGVSVWHETECKRGTSPNLQKVLTRDWLRI